MYLEGNNGADYIKIQELADGQLALEVGHCCVITLKHIIPVEWLSAVLSEAVIDTNGDIGQCLDVINWPDDFKQELKRRIVAAPSPRSTMSQTIIIKAEEA